MQDEEKAGIGAELKKAVENGRVTCRAALELAERLGFDPRLVGEVANEEHIKIISCQLGCF